MKEAPTVPTASGDRVQTRWQPVGMTFMRRAARWGFATMLLPWTVGCSENDLASDGSTSATAELDRLRSMPYLSYTLSKADREQTSVTRHDESRSYPGYNLYTTPALCLVELIDASGAPVNSWTRQPCQQWSHAELLPSGDLLVVGRATMTERYLLRLSWDGTLLWERPMPVHHDVEMTPSGELLTLTMSLQIVPEIDDTLPTRDDRLTLLSPTGEAVQWLSLYDQFTANLHRFPLLPVRAQPRADGQTYADLFHANSVEWMRRPELESRGPLYAPDNVLVSMRHQNRVVIVSWTERKLLWSWGLGEISGPHDATWLATGNILLLDNGLGQERSRVLEVDPTSNEIVWEYQAPEPTDFYTATMGAAQRLPNGNTLIAASESGRAFEVGPGGEIVWEFWSPHLDSDGRRATLVRMKRYEAAMVDALRDHRKETGDAGDR